MTAINQSANIITGKPYNVYFDKYPDKCFRCHNNMTPLFKVAIVISPKKNSYVDAAFQCSNSKCNKMVIGEYLITDASGNTIQCVLQNIPLCEVFFTSQINAEGEEQHWQQ